MSAACNWHFRLRGTAPPVLMSDATRMIVRPGGTTNCNSPGLALDASNAAAAMTVAAHGAPELVMTAPEVAGIRVGPGGWLRVSNDGVAYANRMRIDQYVDLVQRLDASNATSNPPSAAALAVVYASLSNAANNIVFNLPVDAPMRSIDTRARFLFGSGGDMRLISGSNAAFTFAESEAAPPIVTVDAAGVRLGAATLLAPGPAGQLGVGLSNGAPMSATLHVNGTVFTTEELFGLSDARVKADIAPIQGALAKARRVAGCTYRMTADGPQGRRRLGVLAQDALEAVPEAVMRAEDGRLSVAYPQLVALCLSAIAELADAVDANFGTGRDATPT